MMSFKFPFDFDLQLFAEGGDGGSNGGDSAATDAEASSNTSAPNEPEMSRAQARQAKAAGTISKRGNELANVQYGINTGTDEAPDDGASDAEGISGADEASTAEQSSSTAAGSTQAVDRMTAFRQLMTGEYREEFNGLMNHLMARQNTAPKMDDTTSQILKLVGDKYGQTDPAKLLESIQNDDSVIRREAARRGMTVDQYKLVRSAEAARDKAQQELQAVQQREQVRQIRAQWEQDAQKCKEAYPDFDIQKELQNKDFADLLRLRVPMQKAYELAHLDEIKASTARSAAEAAETRMANRVADRARRPAENGARQSAASTTVKNDVTKLSRADREEIERRVMRGETIVF